MTHATFSSQSQRLLAVLLCATAAACSGPDATHDADGTPDAPPSELRGEVDAITPDAAHDALPDAAAYPLDDTLRVNHLQARGTHNSYHVRPNKPQVPPDWDYTMAPLDVQFGEQGVRHVELDLHWLAEGGFGVYHVAPLDQGSTCGTLDACLGLVRAWSDANPAHHLISIMLEPKDDFETRKLDEHYDELEAVIVATLGREKLLTPDDVRGGHATLREALEADGWPTLGATRGRVMIVLNDEGHAREVYLAGDPTLAGRLLFARGGQGEPFGAFLEYGNPVGDEAQIVAAVEAGYLVRTSAVGAADPGDEAAEAVAAALRSGAHWIASDFPAPAAGHDVWLDLPGGTPSLCNPQSAPAGCTASDIERGLNGGRGLRAR